MAPTCTLWIRGYGQIAPLGVALLLAKTPYFSPRTGGAYMTISFQLNFRPGRVFDQLSISRFEPGAMHILTAVPLPLPS